jgi:hypothetical protein
MPAAKPEKSMKILFAVSALAVACALSGCASSATRDAIAQAVAEKIPYCSGDIQVAAGIGGIAGTGTGLTNNGQLHCPGKPYEATVTPGATISSGPPAAQ